MNRNIVQIYIQENFSEKAPTIKKLQKEQPRLFDAIYDYTSDMPKNTTLVERCYFMKSGLEERPVCACGKLLKFKSYKKGYPEKCSKDCKG
mgnify:CR=1 FL=1